MLKESLCQLDILLNHLPVTQKSDLIKLIRKFLLLFGDTLMCTTLIKYDTDVVFQE